MPAQALQLSGRCTDIDHRRTCLQSSTYRQLVAYQSIAVSTLHNRKPLGHTAAYVRKSNLQVAAASYTSLSPSNGTARPASSSGPVSAPQPVRTPPAVDHSKATIKVQQVLLKLHVLLSLRSSAKCYCNAQVIGVGGGGSNAVNRMLQSDLQGVEFWIANTDSQVSPLGSPDCSMASTVCVPMWNCLLCTGTCKLSNQTKQQASNW